jgi:hypothetical protein
MMPMLVTTLLCDRHNRLRMLALASNGATPFLFRIHSGAYAEQEFGNEAASSVGWTSTGNSQWITRVPSFSAHTAQVSIGPMTQWLNDPGTVAEIVHTLRQVYGDDIARVMLTEGTTVASVIDALLQTSIDNRRIAKLVTTSLHCGDFIVTPDISGPSHIRYIYDRPSTLQFVDMVIVLPEVTLASTDIRLRLRSEMPNH